MKLCALVKILLILFDFIFIGYVSCQSVRGPLIWQEDFNEETILFPDKPDAKRSLVLSRNADDNNNGNDDDDDNNSSNSNDDDDDNNNSNDDDDDNNNDSNSNDDDDNNNDKGP